MSVSAAVGVEALAKYAVAAAEVSVDALVVACSLVVEVEGILAASTIVCYLASSLAASEDVELLAAGTAVDTLSLVVAADLAGQAVAAFALVGCKRVGLACMHSFAAVQVLVERVLEGLSWSLSAVCVLDADLLLMTVGTGSAAAVMGHVETVA